MQPYSPKKEEEKKHGAVNPRFQLCECMSTFNAHNVYRCRTLL